MGYHFIVDQQTAWQYEFKNLQRNSHNSSLSAQALSVCAPRKFDNPSAGFNEN